MSSSLLSRLATSAATSVTRCASSLPRTLLVPASSMARPCPPLACQRTTAPTALPPCIPARSHAHPALRAMAPSTAAASPCRFSPARAGALRSERTSLAAAAPLSAPSASRAAIRSLLSPTPPTSHRTLAHQHGAPRNGSGRGAARVTAEAFDFADGPLSRARPRGDGDADEDCGEDGKGGEARSDIVFVGTGTSEGIPRVSCLTNPYKICPVCEAATQPGNRNRRRNTSLLIRHRTHGGADGPVTRNILIDAGKFFYHSALQWFPYHNIRHIDAVLITHSHADAIGGLDDLRDWTNNVQDDIPVFASQRDLTVMEKTHYYLMDTSSLVPGTAVSALHFHAIDTSPFHVHGLQVTPLPVWHGANYLSFGYRFGDVCYISDVSAIPESTYPLLDNCKLLILDALRPDRSSASHFGLPQALEEVRKIRPQRTLFTGMMHVMEHESVSAQLRQLQQQEGLDVDLAYDGMRVPIDL
ncbi:unnamed protein product [Closterium sp. Naga37s-1]|nr:unnamed protein product [Closterium sp. Naga37s-1]